MNTLLNISTLFSVLLVYCKNPYWFYQNPYLNALHTNAVLCFYISKSPEQLVDTKTARKVRLAIPHARMWYKTNNRLNSVRV